MTAAELSNRVVQKAKVNCFYGPLVRVMQNAPHYVRKSAADDLSHTET
jgi:hypothetical protein